MKYFFLIALFILPAHDAFSNSLIGGVNVTRNTAYGAAANPASTALVKQSQFQLGGPIFSYGSKVVQYPGLPAWEKSSTGPGIPLEIPASVIKIRKNIGISALLLPPIPITVPLPKIEGIPLYILGQLTESDVEVSGQLGGLLKLQAGIALNKKIALGVGFLLVSASGNSKVFPAGRTDVSIDMGADILTISSNLGIRFNPTRNISLGLKTAFATMRKVTIKTGVSEFPEVEQGGDLSLNLPWNSFSAGLSFKLGSATFYIETDYQGVTGEETGVSLSPPAVKPSDVYPTANAKIAVEYRLKRTFAILAGGKYQPARLGPGSQGPDGKHGYGGLEYLLGNALPIGLTGGLAPSYSIGGGIEYSFLPEYKKKSIRRGRKSRRSFRSKYKASNKQKPSYYHVSLMPGIAVKKASRGIDETGDTPASYDHFNMALNLVLIYRR